MPPAAIMAASIGASTIGSLFGNRKTAAEKAMEGTARQQGVMANQIASMAKQQHTLAGPAMQKAMQHYLQLAGGNRGALNSAMGPERAGLMETYRGAEQGMTARMAPGAQRDNAIAELYRNKAGQMGTMGMQARGQAFNQLGNMGMDMMGQGNAMFGNAAAALGGQANTQSQLASMARQRQQAWGQIGQNIGNIFMPYLMGRMGGAGGPAPLVNRAQSPRMWMTGMPG